MTQWVAEEVRRLRALPYEELLLREGQDLHNEWTSPSGVSVMPPSVASSDFIRAPDGSFIDE